ncbi:MAG: hypothetical protein GY739_15235 [Mesoflavibacter sp.]|nr:hypothetical protein [Mesoflavibacter sp.]
MTKNTSRSANMLTFHFHLLAGRGLSAEGGRQFAQRVDAGAAEEGTTSAANAQFEAHDREVEEGFQGYFEAVFEVLYIRNISSIIASKGVIRGGGAPCLHPPKCSHQGGKTIAKNSEISHFHHYDQLS